MATSLPTRTLWLTTGDGVRLSAAFDRFGDGDRPLTIVAHGFTGTWRHPRSRAIAGTFGESADVLAFDFRGHGASGGVSTVGDKEVHDVAAAVAVARRSGYRRIRLVGFSMGAAVVIRYGGLFGGVDAIAAVSGPATWFYKGTTVMRWLHRAIDNRTGRWTSRLALRTRIDPQGWPTKPMPPWEAASRVAPIPLLVVHGTADRFFPRRHAYALYEAAADPKQLWIEPGMGHAESAMTPDMIRRIASWLDSPESDTDPRPSPSDSAPVAVEEVAHAEQDPRRWESESSVGIEQPSLPHGYSRCPTPALDSPTCQRDQPNVTYSRLSTSSARRCLM
ncbi:alpha/beta hydrolase [Stackebrandtia soli]|uniref:alpha/beta hydrolase n=1 Tax=Stackebrandtia soli TaxID=1892856 RepID=UPI0039EB8C78